MAKGRGMPPRPEQGAVTRRYVVMLQAGDRCASGKLARRFQEPSEAALPMPRVLTSVLGKAARKALLEDEAAQNDELERRWPHVAAYRQISCADWRARRRF